MYFSTGHGSPDSDVTEEGGIHRSVTLYRTQHSNRFQYLLESTRVESIRADSVFVKKIGLSIQQLSSNFYCLIFIVDSADNKLIIVVHVKCKCNHVNAMSNKHHKNI